MAGRFAEMADKEQEVAATEIETTPPSETPGGQQEQELSPAELKAQLASAQARIKELNKESEKHRKKATELETAEQKRKDAELSETERLNKQLKEAQDALTARDQQIQERAIRSAIQVEAVRQGFNDPEDALRADVLASIAVNEDGEVTGVKEALAQLAKEKPYLVGSNKPAPPRADAGAGNQPERGGAVLTPGEQAAVQAAQNMGYHIDPKKVAERKAATRVVSAQSREQE